MNNDLYAQKVLMAFLAASFIKDRTKPSGDYIAPFDCPFCGKKDKGYAHYPFPGRLFCNSADCIAHKDNGGQSTAEYLGITFDIEKEYKPSPKEPNKPVRPYLESRGLGLVADRLNATYMQNIRGSGRGGIKIKVGINEDGNPVYFCRIINPPAGFGKAHFSKKVSGCMWSLDGYNYDNQQPTYCTEGIFDAASIFVMGGQAVAILSTNQDLEKLDLGRFPNLTAAFDNDPQGIKTLKKFLKVYPNAKAIMLEPGIDYNDILCSAQSPVHGKAIFHANLERYKNNAQLNLSENAHEYGRMYYEFFGKVPGIFTFDGSTYFTELLTRGDTPRPKTERLGLFTLEVLSYINVGTAQQKEFFYQLRVKPKGPRAIDCVASGKNLSSAKDIGSFLLSHACVNYEGKGNATTALGTMITTSKAPEVRQVQTVGFDPSSKWYVFDSYAIDPQGKIHFKDKTGLFKIGGNERITPAAQAGDKAIKPSFDPKASVKQIYDLFHAAWGENGAMAYSWTMAAWFVNQVKDKVGFFPYADLSGLPSTGKSALVTKLQNLQGVDGEGLNISETSTKKGMARKIHGISGMFCALLEFTEDNIKAMGFINILSAYNRGGGDMIQAKFSNDLETKQTPLLAALLFCQNKPPWKNQQEKQRAVSLHFDTKSLSASTKAAYNKLNDISKEDIASVMVEVLKQRTRIEAEWYHEYLVACGDLESVVEERIRNNHGLILGFNRLICKIFGIEADIFTHIEQTALLKEKTSAELEINEASLFFEQVYSSTSEQKLKYWHEIDKKNVTDKGDSNSLYFSLTEMLRLLQNEGLQPPRANDLQEALRRHPAYISHKTNHRFPSPPIENNQGPTSLQRKAWKFDLAKFREIENPPNHEEVIPF